MTDETADSATITPAPTGEAAPATAESSPAPEAPGTPAADAAPAPVAEVAPPAPTFPDGAPIPADQVAAVAALPPAASTEPPAPARSDSAIPAPTIGRIVLHRGKDQKIRPAIVTHVWGVFCVNLFVFPKDNSDEEAGPKTSVTHADPVQEPGCYQSWHWMPYQLGQAAKTTAAEAKLAKRDEVIFTADQMSYLNGFGAGLDVLAKALVELGDRIGHPVKL